MKLIVLQKSIETTLFIMNLSFLIPWKMMRMYGVFLLLSVSLTASGLAQKINLSEKNKPLKEVLNKIKDKSGYDIFYSSKLVEQIVNVNIVSVDQSLETVLNQLFKDLPFEYILDANTIILRERASPVKTDVVKLAQQQGFIKGKLVDENGKHLGGVSIVNLRTKTQNISTAEGDFIIKAEVGDELLIKWMGYEDKSIIINDYKELHIRMLPTLSELDDVIVTGYFNKTRENFTGSAVTIQGEELAKVGSLNLIQALTAFDPSIRLNESLVNGSNPNLIPDITIRGENSLDLRANADNALTNPNAPLYILDGIEVSAQRIYDMDMNRIESATILKDASATSLYGSRGANGVILVTTIRPKPGQIRIGFNSTTNISTPDLRDYNLMNAAQKLEYELRAGVYHDPVYEERIKLEELYNTRLGEVQRGVDTYWLSQPLQTSVNQRTALNFEGGDKNFRYGLDVRYDSDRGVMKKSGRDKKGLGFAFDYNIGTNFVIRNNFNVDNVKALNTPYSDFQSYANQNPYDRIYDESGQLVKRLSTGSWNPLADVHLPRKDQNNYVTVQDNLNMDWRIIPTLRFQGRLGYTKQINRREYFKSPASVSYTDEPDPKKRGYYELGNSRSDSFDGNFTLSYFKFIKNHNINLGFGSNFQQNESLGESFTAVGFVSPDITFIGSALGFLENSKPNGSYDKSRLIGFFGNLNYGYDDRFFIDFSYRTDGSSKFGRNSRFAPFWSTGVAWNIHQEKWWDHGERSFFKVRASIGSTGTTNFSSSQALSTYLTSFSNEYNNIFGVDLAGYGNPDLKWQNTMSYNAGVDLTMFNGFLSFNGDFYIKKTANLLLPVSVVPSTGFRDYIENIGELRNTGMEGRLRFNLLENNKRDMRWNVTLMAFRNTGKITKLSNQLEAINANSNDDNNNQGLEVYRTFQAGRSQTALMLVQSGGIDPATGNEVYIKRDGSLTFDYDNNDKVLIGDMKPTVEGNISSNFYYKGFNLYVLMRYKFGGKAYNSTLASKVEGSNPLYNADLRVLENRWKEPGDHALFRRIDDRSRPYQTSRLVFDDDLLSLQTLSITYELPQSIAQRLYTKRFRVVCSSTDLVRFSSIKQERGTSYPFARTFNIGFNASF